MGFLQGRNWRFVLCTLLLSMQFSSAYAADWLYTFRPGDTLWDICKQYTKEPACWQKLGPLNEINANRRIAPGTRIRIPAAWLKVPAASATILFVQGKVERQTPDGQSQPAAEDDKLPIGASIVTHDGSATIGFADGSTIVLEAHSALTLDTLSNFEDAGMVDSTVRLQHGTIKTRVIKREPRSLFKTITPTAVASVRGTEYRVNLVPAQQTEQKQKALVEVYEGLVDVGAQQTSFPVPAEYGIVTRQGEAPQAPVKLLTAPVFSSSQTSYSRTMDADGIQTEAIQITWHEVAGAASYRLQILADPAQSNTEKLLQNYKTTNNGVSVNGLKAGCYRLDLRANDQAGLQGMAGYSKLCLARRLAAPLIHAPSDVSAGTSLSVSWQAVTGSTHYQIELAEDAQFTRGLKSIDSLQPSFTLQGETPVYIRVTAMGEKGNASLPSRSLFWQPSKPEEEDWTVLIPIGLYLIGLILI